jgi:hypothetical protein
MSFLLHISIISSTTLHKLNVFLFSKKATNIYLYISATKQFLKRTFFISNLNFLRSQYMSDQYCLSIYFEAFGGIVCAHTSHHIFSICSLAAEYFFAHSPSLNGFLSHSLSLPSLSISLPLSNIFFFKACLQLHYCN